jgi:hypothetical protein
MQYSHHSFSGIAGSTEDRLTKDRSCGNSRGDSLLTALAIIRKCRVPAADAQQYSQQQPMISHVGLLRVPILISDGHRATSEPDETQT